MKKSTRTREPVKPVTGSVRWVKRMVLPHGLGRLAITSITQAGPVVAEYDVGCHLDERGRVTGYRLVRDDDTGYDLPADLSSCDCPDFVFRERECKHLLALRAALPRCSVLV